ncbi:uncharacterized protein V6R79_009719 [Siganus canaliculatus]
MAAQAGNPPDPLLIVNTLHNSLAAMENLSIPPSVFDLHPSEHKNIKIQQLEEKVSGSQGAVLLSSSPNLSLPSGNNLFLFASNEVQRERRVFPPPASTDHNLNRLMNYAP